MLTAGASWRTTDFAPEKRGEAKRKAPSNQAELKPNSKAGQMVDCRADLLKLKTARKLKLPHLIEGWADQATAAERQKTKKKKKKLPNHLSRLWQNIYLNSNTRIGCWRSNTRTETKTEILLFLNLEFFVCLLVLFLICLCLFVHLSTLISLSILLLLMLVLLL
jgi:hypothetical protein